MQDLLAPSNLVSDSLSQVELAPKNSRLSMLVEPVPIVRSRFQNSSDWPAIWVYKYCKQVSSYVNSKKAESHIASEVLIIVLDKLEEFYVATIQQSQISITQGILDTIASVFFDVLRASAPVSVVNYLYDSLRVFIHRYQLPCFYSHARRFPEQMFKHRTTYCTDMCGLVLRHCNSPSAEVRAIASSFLYLLMKVREVILQV